MAGSQKSFSWNADTLTNNVKDMPKLIQRMIVAAVEFTATKGEVTMRKNATWNDQTTNARNGLFTKTFHEANRHTIVFYHSVPYGIWLEVRWAGKYAIILPSVQSSGRDIMALLDKGLARI